MRPRMSVLLVAAALVLAVAVAAWFLVLHTRDQGVVNHGASASSSVRALSAAQADGLAAGLRSGSVSRVSAVVALPGGRQVPPEFVAQLHALKVLRIDPATFRDNADGTGTVRASVTAADGTVASWTVLLARDDAGDWLVTATAPTGSTR